jgi:small conductance mechanosensitive channel
METLRAMFSRWIDPQVAADIVLLWTGRIAAAVAIFVIGRLVASALRAWLRRSGLRIGMDETLSRFLGSVLYIGLLVMVALTAVAALGVPTTNFLAILGAAGLAIGLALRDSLSNFASGVMLVLFRPFKVGDFVDAAGVSGNVESIGIYDTVIKSPDNRVITVPNRLIYAGTITNASSEPVRRIDLVIPIIYQDDVTHAKALIRDVLAADKRILPEPAAEVAVQDLAATTVNVAVRAWVGTAQYGAARGDLLERIKLELESHGMSLTHLPAPPARVVTRAAEPA